MRTAKDVIDALGLKPLEGEGGYFRQTWILPSETERPIGTAIMYLITPDSFSGLHKLDADEIFHFYLGDTCSQIVINEQGALVERSLGRDIFSGQSVQTIVPRGSWQGTKLVDGGTWALVGTTMAPGYLQSGFDLASVNDLKQWSNDVATIATRYLADGA